MLGIILVNDNELSDEFASSLLLNNNHHNTNTNHTHVNISGKNEVNYTSNSTNNEKKKEEEKKEINFGNADNINETQDRNGNDKDTEYNPNGGGDESHESQNNEKATEITLDENGQKEIITHSLSHSSSSHSSPTSTSHSSPLDSSGNDPQNIQQQESISYSNSKSQDSLEIPGVETPPPKRPRQEPPPPFVPRYEQIQIRPHLENPPITRLYIDGMNYGGRFFKGRDHWNVIFAIEEIKSFVESAKKSGVELKVFIDADMLTKEAKKKWKTRREREVRKSERRSPQGMNAILGDAFMENGVSVLYSWEADNDDTLAAYAQKEGAGILSEDQDFFRYVGKTYRVFCAYSIDADDSMITLTEVFKRRRVSRRPIAEILPKAPSTIPRFTGNLYQRGTPTPLIKEMGNCHIKIRPLRQAYYARLNKTVPIKEVFPYWNHEIDDVDWTDDDVHPDSTYDHLLNSPLQAVEQFFPEEFKRQKNPPEGICKLEWGNHVYAAYATAFEICSMATGESLLNMLRPIAENWKMVYHYTCKICQKESGCGEGEIDYYEKKGHSLPKTCPECRAKRFYDQRRAQLAKEREEKEQAEKEEKEKAKMDKEKEKIKENENKKDQKEEPEQNDEDNVDEDDDEEEED